MFYFTHGLMTGICLAAGIITLAGVPIGPYVGAWLVFVGAMGAATILLGGRR